MNSEIPTLDGRFERMAVLMIITAFFLVSFCHVASADSQVVHGLKVRPMPKAYLRLPTKADGKFPRLLSQTGVFEDTSKFVPSDVLIAYDLLVSFWSDGAVKTRWISVPEGGIHFDKEGEWKFPMGTVFVKSFMMVTNESDPHSQRRLETRLLVCDENGGVYGVTYKWRPDSSDAELLETNLTESISIQTTDGTRVQPWYYPSRQDCLVCHSANAGYVLGVNTRQLNGSFTNSSGVSENQLRAWNHIGLFDTNLHKTDFNRFPQLARTDDESLPLENRARSYLDANCSHCHRPNGTVAYFDSRYRTPLAQQNVVNGRVLINERIDDARVIAPNDIWRSILLMRANTTEAYKMPPLARNVIDTKGMNLLKRWIESLPGPQVLAPPVIEPQGGSYTNPVIVTLKAEAGVSIRYTLDGSVPNQSDPLYLNPIRLVNPTILRAVAFKKGCTKSITSNEIFVING
jgi:uncharacterized repeat protein (TIGR03806 family)